MRIPPIQSPAAPTPDTIARVLRDVLAREEYVRGEQSESWFGRFVRWLMEWLSGLTLPELPGGRIVDVLAIAVMAFAAVLAVRALWARRAAAGHRRPTRTAPSGTPQVRATDRSAEDWESLARQLATEGRPREAALALYQAVLRRLADAGLIRYHASKTPGEYRRELRGHDVAAAYRTFLTRFEPVAFGRVTGGDVAGLFPLATAAAPDRG